MQYWASMQIKNDAHPCVCMINHIIGNTKRQFSFSSRSKEKKHDEYEYIKEVVKKTKVKAKIIFPEKSDLIKNLGKITWIQDEPFGSSSIFAQWKVFNLAKKSNVKVLLDGQGADEQFAGYPIFNGINFSILLKKFKIFKLICEMFWFAKIHNKSFIFSTFYLFEIILPNKLKNFIRNNLGKGKITPEWLCLDKLQIKPYEPFELNNYNFTSMSSFSHLLLFKSNLPMLLHWLDRNSMSNSVEGRVPFLDHKLVEFVLSLPDDEKLNNGLSKVALRNSLKNILPKKIHERKTKLGFELSEEKWIKSESAFEKIIIASPHITRGIINEKAIIHLKKMLDNKIDYNHSIWRIISFTKWVKKFNVKI